ncbi:unnamed protein product [Calicophoron daubneyi]|uniref:Serum response factor-binding protein 1 n=1 Tax=Calicophoron daubneyi TaxID=300641 RepID=A0AAV2TQF2_CALDB
MTNALKEHEKEFTKISNEVKKFISSAGPKSGAENDEALAKRKNELKDALITISARTAELKQEGGNKKSDVKFEANKKKLLSKMDDLRIKLEGYTVETETKTLKPKTSRGSPRRRRKKEKQGETVAGRLSHYPFKKDTPDENLGSEKAKRDDDKEAIERDIDKKEGELSTGDVQSLKEEIEESEDDEETAAGDRISEKCENVLAENNGDLLSALSVPQKEKNEKLPKTAEEKRSGKSRCRKVSSTKPNVAESTEDTFHTEPEDKSEALDEEITELDEDTDVTNLGKPESHVVKSGEADSTMDDVTVSQLEGGLGDDSEEGEEKSEAKDKGNLNMMESVEVVLSLHNLSE